MFFTSPTGVPSCLKPVAQQEAGGLEAMMKMVNWMELNTMETKKKKIKGILKGSSKETAAKISRFEKESLGNPSSH